MRRGRRIHGVERARCHVTGAHAFDHWFSMRPTLTRGEFLAKVGLPEGPPLILYLCSSRFIAKKEAMWVERWIKALRCAADERVRTASILIRPHPQNAKQWDGWTSPGPAVQVFPTDGEIPVGEQERANYYHSMLYADVIVGLNTSALIEAAIFGKPVLSVAEAKGAKYRETLHFGHLKKGLLIVARDHREHVRHIRRRSGFTGFIRSVPSVRRGVRASIRAGSAWGRPCGRRCRGFGEGGAVGGGERVMSEQEQAAPAKEKRPRDPEKWIHRPMEKYRKGQGRDGVSAGPGSSSRWRTPWLVQGGPCWATTGCTCSGRRSAILELVPGNAVEIGTYRGGSAFFIAGALQAMTGAEVRLDVFDTFEGHPPDALSEHDTYHKTESGLFEETSYEDVKWYLAPFSQAHVHKGDVLLALPHLPEASYRLAHVDTDLYLPTKACLEYFGHRLSPGGIVVVDDYSSPNCPGVRAAAVDTSKGAATTRCGTSGPSSWCSSSAD